MKSVINSSILFRLYIFISIIEIIISRLDINYPSALSLSNGNIFIVEKKGIFVYDGHLKNVIYIYIFEEGEQINNLDIFSNVIVKFKNNYIICLVNNKIFFFDYEGKFLLKTENVIVDLNIYNLALTPISLNVENFYYYIIGYYIYTDNQYKLKLLYYKLNYYDKTNDKITDLIVDNVDASKILGLFGGVYYFQNKGLSCEYMKVTNQPNNYLVCFYITIRDDKLYLISNFYDISTSSLEITDDYSPPDAEEISDVISIQSLTSNDRQTAFISLLFRNNQLFSIKFYFEYHFWTSNDVEFYGKSLVNSDCKNELYGMKLYYLADAQKIILSCINPISTVYAFFYGDDLNQINSYNQFSQCESIYGHSIVYSKNDLSFYIVSDVICQNYKRYYEPLAGDLSEIEIEIDSTQIIEDTEAKKEEENEEETTNYYEEEKIEEKEEENQEEMNEEELEIETTEIKFDCSGLEKCKECDKESFDINLCIS